MKILLLNFSQNYLDDFVEKFNEFCSVNNIGIEEVFIDDKGAFCKKLKTGHVLLISNIKQFLNDVNGSAFDLVISLGYEKLFSLFNGQFKINYPLFILDVHMLAKVEELGKESPLIKNKKFFQKIFFDNEIKIFSCFPYFIQLYRNIGISRESLIWVKFPIDINNNLALKKRLTIKEDNFILAPGNHERDFETLLNAYKSLNLNMKLVVIADKRKYQDLFLNKIGGNIIVKDFMELGKFFAYLHKAKFAVLPLRNENNLCNGLTFLAHCFIFKKPLIVTDNLTIKDYIINGYNALLTKPEDVHDLAIKIKYFSEHENKTSQLGLDAFKYAQKYMSFEHLFGQIFAEYDKYKN